MQVLSNIRVQERGTVSKLEELSVRAWHEVQDQVEPAQPRLPHFFLYFAYQDLRWVRAHQAVFRVLGVRHGDLGGHPHDIYRVVPLYLLGHDQRRQRDSEVLEVVHQYQVAA